MSSRSPRAERARRRETARQKRVERVARGMPSLHRFVVQKPFCIPARDRVFSVLYNANNETDSSGNVYDGATGDKKYGVPVYNYNERISKTSISDAAKLLRIELKDKENIKYGPAVVAFLPLAWEASFDVPAHQAKWAEYLLERVGLAVVSGSVDGRNRQNADKHGFKPPPRWDGKTPMIEKTCSEGKELWQALAGKASD